MTSSHSEGTLVRKFSGHEGKSIWSCAADNDTSTVFTGGGDGSVRSWSLQPEDLDPSIARVTAGMSMVTSTTVKKGNGGGGDGSGGEQKDFPRTIAVVDRALGFVCTHGGAVHAVDLDRVVPGAGEEPNPPRRTSAVRTVPVASLTELAGHNILAAVSNLPVGCAGGSKGDLVLFGCDAYAQEPYLWQGHDTSVCAIFWPITPTVGGVGGGGGAETTRVPLFTCAKGMLKWWRVELMPFTAPVLVGTLALPGAGEQHTPTAS